MAGCISERELLESVKEYLTTCPIEEVVSASKAYLATKYIAREFLARCVNERLMSEVK